MYEKILNDLKARKSLLMNQMKNYLQKVSNGSITDAEKEDYKNIKETIAEIENSILETKELMEKEDLIENKSNVEVKSNKSREAFVNFLRYGETEGVETVSNKDGRNIKNVDRTSAAAVVPAELEKDIRLKIDNLSILRKISNVNTIGSREKDIPVEGSEVAVAWIDEGTEFTESDTTVTKKTLKPYKNGALVKATTELIEDAAVDIESYITYKIAKGLNTNFETTALLNTTDNGKKPLGLVAQAITAVTTNAGADKISAADVTALYFAVKQGYRKNGTWLVDTNALKILVDLEDTNGNRIYVPSYVPNLPDTLLGRPVYEIENLGGTAVGKYPLIFGDFSQLEIGVRKGITLTRLNELFRTTGKIGFLAEERIDSVLIFDEAIKTLKIGAAG